MDATGRWASVDVAEETWRDVIAQLRAFVRRRIADPDRAEDLVGDILLRIHRNVGPVDDRERLVATPHDVPAAEPDDAGEALDELARALLPGLPVEQRRAVELIDLDGLPQAEAARREGVSLSGMKSRVQRGRRLAELLDACCALTLDARGLPMDYTPNPCCDGCT